MHKAKTPKLLISVLAVFSLIFGGVALTAAPAQAAILSGCPTSSWTPNKCQGGATPVAIATNVTGSTGTPISWSYDYTTSSNYTAASCATPTYGLYLATDTSYLTALAKVAGINFSTSTGQFSGTPTTTLSQTAYSVAATCANGNVIRYSVNVTVTSGGGAPIPYLTPDSVYISGTVGTAITSSAALAGSNFDVSGAVIRYSVTNGTLPAGLTLDPDTGVISGNPTAVNSGTIVVTGTNGTQSATTTVIFSIEAAPAAGGGAAAPEPSRKVTICHRTHAVTNPYVRITVDYNSVNKKSGHQGHDEIFAGEHVFKAGIYKRAKDKDWGDIIPADPSGLNRWKPLNWTPLGADIYNGKVEGCGAFDPVKFYNAQREAGVPEKKIKQEIGDLETEQAEAEPTTKKSNVSEIKYTGNNNTIAEEDNDKVTLCHRTNSITNPYVRITVAASSVYKKSGHYGHDEIYDGHHVFDSSVNYPNNQKDWGDIIPADSTGKNRWAALNMTALGKQIYDGTVPGCAEKDLQTLYNELREEGKSKKEILADLEKEKNTDVDPKDIDELEYTGNDPKTEKTEPKEPVDPNDPTIDPAAVKIPDQSLSGIVWLDINKDGLKDPDEPFMKGIRLYVVQLTSVPAPVTPANILVNATVRRAEVPSVKAAAVTSVLTDANGFYLFPSLGAGEWKVTTTVPNDLYVTYDSHESSDGEIITTVPVSSHAFTWVGLVGQTESVTLAKITEILKENPNALPLAEVPPSLKTLVKQAKAIIASGKTPVFTENGLAYTGTNDLALLFFGVLLMLSGLALRLARTKR